MGADWVKFKVRSDADPGKVRQQAVFVSEQFAHGHWLVTPPTLRDDSGTRAQWEQTWAEIKNLLLFPPAFSDGYWACTALTDPPGSNLEVLFGGGPRVIPLLADIDICRVYVVSHNAVFPIEWRDEAYRIILPEELPSYLTKWRTYLEEVRHGEWEQYLHELFLFDCLTDEHQLEQFEDLVRLAEESLIRSNAWCRKEPFRRVRDEIMEFNAFKRLNALRAAIPMPKFDESKRPTRVDRQHLARENSYWELRQACALQIKDWNSRVPKGWKVQIPGKWAFEDFMAQADSNWLKNFFAWCQYLIDERYGLFLWA